jgi:hypothetical protein
MRLSDGSCQLDLYKPLVEQMIDRIMVPGPNGMEALGVMHQNLPWLA